MVNQLSKVLSLPAEGLHRESVEIFSRLSNEDLNRKSATPEGSSITVWKWLRAMVEHEVHHRGQIYLYLAMLEVPTRRSTD